jgi:hypothetical protein
MNKNELKKQAIQKITFEIGNERGNEVLAYDEITDTFDIVRCATRIGQTIHALAPIHLTDEMVEAIVYDADAECLKLMV